MAAGEETGIGVGTCPSNLSLVNYGYLPALLCQEVCGANPDRPAPNNKYVNMLGHPGILLLTVLQESANDPKSDETGERSHKFRERIGLERLGHGHAAIYLHHPECSVINVGEYRTTGPHCHHKQ